MEIALFQPKHVREIWRIISAWENENLERTVGAMALMRNLHIKPCDYLSFLKSQINYISVGELRR